MNLLRQQALVQPHSRFLRFLHSDVAAWRRRRWVSTAATARDLPGVAKRTGKRVPKAERKVMVEAFVNQYRASNAGKFPGVTNTVKHVGGSSYVIRAILQELEYNFKISTGTGVDQTSTEMQTARGNRISEIKEIADCTMPESQTTGSSYLGQVNQNISQRMVDVSTLTKSSEIVAEDVSHKIIDLELEQQSDTSATPAVDSRQPNRSWQSREALEEPNCPEKTSAYEDFEFSEKAGHPSEIPSTIRSTEIGETDKLSVHASESDESTRGTTIRSTQDDLQKPSLWGSLKAVASNFFKIWR